MQARPAADKSVRWNRTVELTDLAQHTQHGVQLQVQVSDLQSGGQYVFRIRAINAAGAGEYSTEQGPFRVNPRQPDTPTRPHVIETSFHTAKIAIERLFDGGSAIEKYEIELTDPLVGLYTKTGRCPMDDIVMKQTNWAETRWSSVDEVDWRSQVNSAAINFEIRRCPPARQRYGMAGKQRHGDKSE